MVFIQDRLKSAGIDISIEALDAATMEKRYVARDFGISFNLSTQPVDGLDLYPACYRAGGGRNCGGFSDKQVDDWYQEQSRTLDIARRKEMAWSIVRREFGSMRRGARRYVSRMSASRG